MNPPRDETALVLQCGTVRKFNALEAGLAKLPQLEAPLRHIFTPGLYVREIFLPKGSWLTSRVHKTTHPFVVLKGDISVYSENEQSVRYKAPFMGVTLPGTRRMLFAHEDTVWVTYHVTDLTDPDEIVETITDTPDNPAAEKNLNGVKNWSATRVPSIVQRFKQETLT